MLAMTTASSRPRPRRTRPSSAFSNVDRRPITLAEFSRQLAEHADLSGRSVTFMSHLVELAGARADIATLKKRRALIFEQIKHRYATGVTSTSDGLCELRMSRAAPSTTVRTVDSDVAKRTDPDAWLAARVVVPRVVVRVPQEKEWDTRGAGSPLGIAPGCLPRLPAVPRAVDNLDRCVAAYRHRVFDRLEALHHDETVWVGRLETIADEYGWDGMPIAFSDGWSVGLRTLRFDSDRFAELQPTLFDELATEKTRGGSTRIYLANPGDETVELDAE